jgi:hypothetical protein
MDNLLRDFDEFYSFCFKHGGALKGHWEFGQMANELRAKIVDIQEEEGEYCGCFFADVPLTLNTEGKCGRCGKYPLR